MFMHTGVNPQHDLNLKSSSFFRVLLEFDLNIFKKKRRVKIYGVLFSDRRVIRGRGNYNDKKTVVDLDKNFRPSLLLFGMSVFTKQSPELHFRTQ